MGVVFAPYLIFRKQVLYPLSYEGSIIAENAAEILPHVFWFAGRGLSNLFTSKVIVSLLNKVSGFFDSI
jgi:hypothetical protein